MTARAGRGFVIALAAVVIVAGAPSLFRPGYSPDEEFTVFAVRGIRAHGLPLLPSGVEPPSLRRSLPPWGSCFLAG